MRNLRKTKLFAVVSAFVLALAFTLFDAKTAQAWCGGVEQVTTTFQTYGTQKVYELYDPNFEINKEVRVRVTHFNSGSPGVIAKLYFVDTNTYHTVSWTITSSNVGQWFQWTNKYCGDVQVHLFSGSSTNQASGVVEVWWA